MFESYIQREDSSQDTEARATEARARASEAEMRLLEAQVRVHEAERERAAGREVSTRID